MSLFSRTVFFLMTMCAVYFLATYLFDCFETPYHRASHVTVVGSTLSAQDAENLERRLASVPSDRIARMKLLGYYAGHFAPTPAANARRKGHLLWMIHNLPDDPFFLTPHAFYEKKLDSLGYAQLMAAFKEQADLHPKNAQVAGNAAAFASEDAVVAIKMWDRAEAIDPKNAGWPQKLGQQFYFSSRFASGEEKRRLVEKSLSAYERSILCPVGGDRHMALEGAAAAAQDLGLAKKARSYAELLRKPL